MEDIVITKDELAQLFTTQELSDDNRGWILNGQLIDIIAIHDKEIKYLQNISNAKYYKLIPRDRRDRRSSIR
jgi:hypothetical protein